MSQDSDLWLECSDAFLLGEAFRRGALRVSSRDLLPDALAWARGEGVPSKVIAFRREEGNKPHDVVGTTYAALLLVSDRFIDTLRAGAVSGWTTFPARVDLPNGKQLTDYHGLAVTGRCGPIDDRLSERILLPAPAPGGQAGPGLRGLCFSPDSWDGSDIFTPNDYAGIFVVERVKQALERAQITNLEFQRLSEITRIWHSNRHTFGVEP